MNIAIIPAKINSIRLPKKNFKLLNKKPLIFYTIEAAIKSKIFDKIIVSTDSKSHNNIGNNFPNVEIHIRPKKLTKKNTSVSEICYHLLNLQEYNNSSYFCCLYPTAPLRNSTDIKNCYKKLVDNKFLDGVFAITEFKHYPYQALYLDGDEIKPFWKNYVKKNSRYFPKFYAGNGSTYFIKTKSFIKKKSLYVNKIGYYIMPFERSVDIDTAEDFNLVKIFSK